MSNSHAIAAVTLMLDYLISQEVGVPQPHMITETVTTLPPDRARKPDATESQINIFLYQTAPNAAWRNRDLPGRPWPGETGAPPLALNLYYLITAYGDDDVSAHQLLGHAMQILHDYSIISGGDILAAGKNSSWHDKRKNVLLEADLQNQVEQLRITPVPLPLDELSRLWSTFNTAYRVSAAYEVSVVLIESTRPVKTPRPVLARGISLQPHLGPQLDAANPPNRQPSIRSGQTLTLTGAGLGTARLHFKHAHLPDQGGQLEALKTLSDTEVKVTIPEGWPAGFYTVTAQVTDAGVSRSSNALSFALAPVIEESRLHEADSTLMVLCRTTIAEGQHVSLLLGDRELLPQAREKREDGVMTWLTFDVKDVKKGVHLLRLRVDGVDSHLIDYSNTPPVFYDDEKHKVHLP